jgi:hypothetical protein
MTQTWYLRFADNGKLERVGCMVCDAEIARHDGEKIVHMSHLKTKLLELNDGSKLELLLCPECNKKSFSTEAELDHIERTARWGYMQEVLAHVGKRPELKEMTKRAADLGKRLKLKRGK